MHHGRITEWELSIPGEGAHLLPCVDDLRAQPVVDDLLAPPGHGFTVGGGLVKVSRTLPDRTGSAAVASALRASSTAYSCVITASTSSERSARARRTWSISSLNRKDPTSSSS